MCYYAYANIVMRKRSGRISSAKPSFYKLILALIVMLSSLVLVYVFKSKLNNHYRQNVDAINDNKNHKKNINIGVRYNENDKKYLDKIIEKLEGNQKD